MCTISFHCHISDQNTSFEQDPAFNEIPKIRDKWANVSKIYMITIGAHFLEMKYCYTCIS